MVARIRKYQGLGPYCLSATLLSTAVLSPSALADFSSAACDVLRVEETLFPPSDCEMDRSAPAMHGPLQLYVDWSDKIGYTVDPKYVNDLGASDALALEFQFGAKLFRASATWGHAFSDNLFFKFTGEYFAERPVFDFLAGEEQKWIGQWDLGADLRYYFPGSGIDSVHINIQTVRAESKNIPDVLFDGGNMINERSIRGGEALGGAIGFRIHPWTSGYFDLDLYYDELKYETLDNPWSRAIGFGGAAAYHQNIGERFQFVLSGTNRRPYYEYLVGIKWIARHSSGSLLELGAHFYEDGGDVPFGRESVFGLGIFYSWGGDIYAPPAIYADPLHRGLRQNLLDYTNVPALRPDQIYSITDQTAYSAF